LQWGNIVVGKRKSLPLGRGQHQIFNVGPAPQSTGLWKTAFFLVVIFFLLTSHLAAASHPKDSSQYGAGLIVNVPFSEAEVVQVVHDVAQNGIIRGTREYSKDQYVNGATEASSTRVFPEWTEGGKVFYKVRLKALDPQNFKDTNDVGTLAVRYVVQGQDDKHTVLRIDARFLEDYRHVSHASNGSVEGEEYKDIHDRLDAITLMKNTTAEAEKDRQERSSSKPLPALRDETGSAPAPSTPAKADVPPAAPVETTNTPPQSPEERLQDLRHQVERVVKAPGAPLKSAPFHTASNLQTLSPGTEVLIEISTPYWLGVETHTGQHGWIMRDELEPLP
jgi:hypothetical protein